MDDAISMAEVMSNFNTLMAIDWLRDALAIVVAIAVVGFVLRSLLFAVQR